MNNKSWSLLVFSKRISNFISLTLLALIVTACGPNKDVAVMIALTQTAAALQSAPTLTVAAPTQAPTSTPLPTSTLQPTVPVAAYVPITAEECTGLQTSMTANLGVDPVVVNPAPFTDYVKNSSGTACQLTYTGNGNNNFSASTNVFSSGGWTEDNEYAAGGPSGVARAFQKNGELCLYSTKVGPADPSYCPADMFFPDCMATLTPSQTLQTVTVSCARYQP